MRRIVIAIAVFSLLSASYFYLSLQEEIKENTEEEQMVKEIESIAINPSKNPSKKENIKEREKEALQESNKAIFEVDFASLLKVNKDVVGYFYWDAFGISEVIVQGKDNEFYLNHNFKKNKNAHGTIFLESKNKADFTNPVSYLFGHNSYNGSKFAKLNRVTKKDYGSILQVHLASGGVNHYELIYIDTILEQTKLYPDDLFLGGGRLHLSTVLKEIGIQDNENDSYLFLITCQTSDASQLRKLLIARKLET